MCNCIAEIENALKDTNTRLDVPIVLNSKSGELSANRVTITTAKRDQKKRKEASRIFASYCPFCGKKYNEQQ
mgnify:CR=1 FL=1